MRLLAAVALLVIAVTEAHHTAEHTLRGPRFSVGKLHVYDVELNATSGIWGLSSQSAKSVLKAELQIYAKSEKEYYLKLTKVYTSGAVKAVEGTDDYVDLQKNRDLEERLSTPIKFTMENGNITSYTLSAKDNFESRKIKKSILRSLEMYVPESAHRQLESKSRASIPVAYNETKYTADSELHTTYYLITVSPNVEFPYHSNVYNISRSENFEGERYPSHKFHHNFDYQGCSDVCNKANENITNFYGAGCPVGYEPHQSPMKTYVNHQHHLTLEDGVMTPEIIETSEVHVAKMYDQDMTVMIELELRKVGYKKRTMEEPSGKTYYNLHDQEEEIQKLETECGYGSPRDAVVAAKRLLKEIAQIIVRGNLEDDQSTLIGEKLILLKEALTKLSLQDFETLSTEIKRLGSLSTASEEEKVKRQVWMDILPVVGTESSVSFIVNYIKNSVEKEVLVWEAKEILEALPQNIHVPSEKTIKELRTLLSVSQIKRNHILHSAAYSCLGRVIGAVCNGTGQEGNQWQLRQSARQSVRGLNLRLRSSDIRSEGCPEGLVSEIVKEITANLKRTTRKDEKVIYIETLTVTGRPEALPIVSEYARGTAEGMQDVSPDFHEFLRTSSVYSLHKVAKKYSEDVLDIVVPLFLNESEIPKLRNAAFSVLIRSKPTLEILQHVAALSWKEKSNEVGSFVTSTLESFGNSTLPCMQLTSRRIQMVMPMLKRFDIGLQHAKNHLWTYFDDVREFGLKGQLSYTPNNQSILPAVIYHGLSYSTDSLTDNLIQTSLHVQGISMGKIIKDIDWKLLGIDPPEDIPQQKEQGIFEQANIASRIPEAWRLTVYRKMFYSSAFYYLDQQNLKIQVDALRDYLKAYLTRTSYDYTGHLVKTYLPSEFHVEAVAQMLPYPVEFKMLQPVVLALKIESKHRNPTLPDFHFVIRPSVYLSKVFVHQFKSIGECERLGVYHEHKLAVSYPLEVKVKVHGWLNMTVGYKVPELPKRVLYYFTEAGTYAGKKSFEKLPSSAENREPIRTLPSPFQHAPEINIVGLPPIQVDIYAEDINLLSTRMPRTPLEALDMAVKRVLNAGWRYKSINVTLKDDSTVWPRDTEVTFNVHYDRSHATKQNLKMSPIQKSQEPRWSGDDAFPDNSDPDFDPTYYPTFNEFFTESTTDEDEQSPWSTQDSLQQWFWNRDSRAEATKEDWSRNLIPKDISRLTQSHLLPIFVQQAKRNSNIILSNPRIVHQLDIQIRTKPLNSFANIRMEYNHTHSKSLHEVQIDATVKLPKERRPIQMTLAHQMEFFGKPDEFRYDSHNDQHTAAFLTAFRARPSRNPNLWQDFDIVGGGMFSHENLPDVFSAGPQDQEEDSPNPATDDLSQECKNDIQEGHPLSVACVKAMREQSIYNKLKMVAFWSKNVPEGVKNGARRLDTFFKHLYYDQMWVHYNGHGENLIHINLTHINKFTDKPVTDVTIHKAHETLELRRVQTLGYALDDPLSSLYGVLGVDLMTLTNNTYPPTCAMMKKYVRTFDMRSYPISLDKCNYVLSAHCTDYKNFAIIAKVLSTSDSQKEIHIHVGTHDIILTPKKGNTYSIKFDGQTHTVSDTLVFDEDKAEIYVFAESFPSSQHLQVVAKKAGIRVIYDGQNVKVQVSPRYKGETCGLCSEFDGETVREFRGIDRCLYSHSDDFVNSAITNKDQCRKQPLHPFTCENDVSRNMVWRKGGDSGDEYEPKTRRNTVIEKGNEVCFSVHPVPVCEENDKPTDTTTESTGFHCLPKRDVTARRLVEEAKRRILGEIENKSVDHEENVEVAKMCSE